MRELDLVTYLSTERGGILAVRITLLAIRYYFVCGRKPSKHCVFFGRFTPQGLKSESICPPAVIVCFCRPFSALCGFTCHTILLRYLSSQTMLPLYMVILHAPQTVLPLKGVARPMVRKVSGSILYSFSRS